MTTRARRWPLIIVAIALVVIVSKLVVEDLLGLTWMGVIHRFVTTPSPAAAATIVLLLSIDLLVPVPSSFVMVLSGATFGVLAGGCLSLVGSLIGNCAGFEVARRYGREATRRFVGDDQLARMQQAFAKNGALVVVVSRPLPVLMETLSVVAGLSGMRRPIFLAASLAGTIPIVFVYSYAGSRSMQEGTIVPAIVILMAVVAAAWVLARPVMRGAHARTREDTIGRRSFRL